MYLHDSGAQEAREEVSGRPETLFTSLTDTRETYLTSLEDRLNRMEAVMLQSGLSMPGKETKPAAADDSGIEDIPDKMSLLKIFDDGTTLFLGTHLSTLTKTVTY